jgi:hypothetical protein
MIGRTSQMALFSFLIMFFLSCSPGKEKADNSVPDEIIQPDTMVSILTEVHIAEAILREMKADNKHKEKMAQNFYSEIFTNHGITREQFLKSIQYYQKKPEVYQEIYESVITQLSQKQTENTSGDK